VDPSEPVVSSDPPSDEPSLPEQADTIPNNKPSPAANGPVNLSFCMIHPVGLWIITGHEKIIRAGSASAVTPF
jgi:hypothetical protein